MELFLNVLLLFLPLIVALLFLLSYLRGRKKSARGNKP